MLGGFHPRHISPPPTEAPAMFMDIDSTQPTDRILKITRTVYVRAEDADDERRAFNTYWFEEAPAMMIEAEKVEGGTVDSFELNCFFPLAEDPAV
jgi:hypothetical protein